MLDKYKAEHKWNICFTSDETGLENKLPAFSLDGFLINPSTSRVSVMGVIYVELSFQQTHGWLQLLSNPFNSGRPNQQVDCINKPCQGQNYRPGMPDSSFQLPNQFLLLPLGGVSIGKQLFQMNSVETHTEKYCSLWIIHLCVSSYLAQDIMGTNKWMDFTCILFIEVW